MRIANPHLLWLLLAAPVVVLAYAIAFAQRRRLLNRLGQPTLIARMAASVSVPRKVLRAALVVLAVALLALALARPQAGGRARLEKQRGLDIVVALDFSKSMLAKDIYPSRLERAKRELERLMDRLAGDRIGLVAFAGETLTYPPTTDYAAVKLFWRDMTPSDIPVGGTAIGRALKAGLEMLKRLRAHGGETRGQVILLLTDGEDTESEPMEVADEAAKLGVKVFAVGIGSRSGELVPELNEEGQAQGYIKDREGKYVTSRLSEDLLSKIAARTGGEYLRADARHFGVEAIEAALAGLKRTENEARLVKRYDEVCEYSALARISDPGWRSVPERTPQEEGMRVNRERPRPRTRFPAAVALLPLLAAWNPLERPNRAVTDGNASLQKGKAEEALAHYDQAAAALPADPAVSLQSRHGPVCAVSLRRGHRGADAGHGEQVAVAEGGGLLQPGQQLLQGRHATRTPSPPTSGRWAWNRATCAPSGTSNWPCRRSRRKTRRSRSSRTRTKTSKTARRPEETGRSEEAGQGQEAGRKEAGTRCRRAQARAAQAAAGRGRWSPAAARRTGCAAQG